jgi:hypothetical protein
MSPDQDQFYIGYLPKAPPATASFVRRVVIAVSSAAAIAAATLAVTLRYGGAGEFEFGRPREVRGTVRCDVAPRLEGSDADYLLVGYGKNRVAPEICGMAGQQIVVQGRLIQREGKRLLEIAAPANPAGPAVAESAPVPLGRFTLRGEIVDSKCYFGVMNPGEGRAHRACAELCLRGGVPAVFVVRDAAGSTAHLILAGPNGTPINEALLQWVGEPIEASGEVTRHGRWLVWRLDLASLRRP